MKKLVLAVGLLLLFVLAGSALLFAATPRVGYCFDAEFDSKGERLFVAAGQKGVHTFSVSPQGTLALLSTYYDEGYYRSIRVVNGFAYVANGGKGLEILDVSGNKPEPVWAQAGSKGMGIEVYGDKAYLAAGKFGLYIFDVSTPNSPHILGQVAGLEEVWDVWVDGILAYALDHHRGLVVLDVSDPSQVRQVGFVTWDEDDPTAEVIDGAGQFVYIASGPHGLIGVEVSDPTQPRVAWQYRPGPAGFGEGVLVYQDTLYASIGDEADADNNGVHVFTLQNLAAPRLLKKVPVSDWPEDIAVANGRLALANTLSGVVLYDIRLPDTPVLVNSYPAAFWRFFTNIIR